MESFKPNKTYYWLATDTKERFKKFLQEENQKKQNLQYYLENPIEYKLNNFGFRTPDDFNSNDEGNLFIGCSHTIGIGLHLENVWSYKLNQIIGGKFWNLGIAGTGVQTHFRLLFGFLLFFVCCLFCTLGISYQREREHPSSFYLVCVLSSPSSFHSPALLKRPHRHTHPSVPFLLIRRPR
jgi:hypothetical protein